MVSFYIPQQKNTIFIIIYHTYHGGLIGFPFSPVSGTFGHHPPERTCKLSLQRTALVVERHVILGTSYCANPQMSQLGFPWGFLGLMFPKN